MMKINPAAIATTALGIYPESVVSDVLSQTRIADDLSIKLTTYTTLADDIVFRREELFSTIKKILSPHSRPHTLTDETGVEWIFSVLDSSKARKIELLSSKGKFFIENIFIFEPDNAIRSRQFEENARSVMLPPEKYEYWRALVLQDEINETDLDALISDMANCPTPVGRSIIDRLAHARIEIASLVPASENYYFDLVGNPSEASTLASFLSVFSDKARRKLSLYKARALPDLLASCWHASLTSTLDLGTCSSEELDECLLWIARHGDVVTRVSGIEMMLLKSLITPENEVIVLDILDGLSGEKFNEELTQLCDLVVLVDGELMLRSALQAQPPFWRRLASFTHASLLQRYIKRAAADTTHLSKSRSFGRIQPFLMRSAVDLRLEPRWHAGYLSGEQLKAEFLGRIYQSASSAERSIPDRIRARIFREPLQNNFLLTPAAFMPGPLEGGECNTQPPLPAELEDAIKVQLSNDIIEMDAFAPLINSSSIFRLEKTHADLASDSLRAAKFQIRTRGNTAHIKPILSGLASLAAANRNVRLAGDVAHLLGLLRHQVPSSLSITDGWWIGLTAAGAFSDLSEWSKFVGKWNFEIASQEMSLDEAEVLSNGINLLCRTAPLLWMTSGQAIASLEALLSR